MLAPPSEAVSATLAILGHEAQFRHCFVFNERMEPVMFASAAGRLAKVEPARKATLFEVKVPVVDMDQVAADLAYLRADDAPEQERIRRFRDMLEAFTHDGHRVRNEALDTWSQMRMSYERTFRSEAFSFAGIEQTYVRTERGWTQDGRGKRTNVQVYVCSNPPTLDVAAFHRGTVPRHELTPEQFTSIWSNLRMPQAIEALTRT